MHMAVAPADLPLRERLLEPLDEASSCCARCGLCRMGRCAS
jgi:hypothetical protein